MSHEINLQNFSGSLPLFPLPNVVLFPHTLLPLHIFERRYRKMLQDTLRGEKLIGMAVLKPGWEEKYEGNPAIYPVACLGTILKHEPLTDGKSNILLLGLKRVRINNIINPRPYRTAKVKILEDTNDELTKTERLKLRYKILELYSDFVIEYAGTGKKFPTLSNAKITLGHLTDAVAAGIGLPVNELVLLLEEVHVGKRAEYVLKRLEELLRKGGPQILAAGQYPDYLHITLN